MSDAAAEFERIITDAIRQACGVPCDIGTFILELEGWVGLIQDEITAARDSNPEGGEEVVG